MQSERTEYYILGIDPSTVKVGLCKMTVDLISKEIIRLETELIDSNALFKHRFLSSSANGNGTQNVESRISIMAEELNGWLKRNHVDIVYMEIPHITVHHLNNVFPLASLKERLEGVISGNGLKLHRLSASTPKGIIGANKRKGKSKDPKQRVLDCVSEIKEITNLINVYSLTDDEVDALIIAYAGWKL